MALTDETDEIVEFAASLPDAVSFWAKMTWIGVNYIPVLIKKNNPEQRIVNVTLIDCAANTVVIIWLVVIPKIISLL